LGESAGDFADTNFSSNLDDLVAAADYLRREQRAPRILIGHSLGGAAVLAAAHRVPEAVAVATVAAPSDTEHLTGVLLAAAPELAESDEAEVALAGRRFTIKRQLLEDLATQQVAQRLADLGRALLILHSPVDEVVSIDHARRLFEAARQPKSFVALDGADHLLSDPRDARYAGDVLAAWAGRYVAEARRPAAGEPAAEEGRVVVAGGPEGYAQQVRVRGHLLRADEPEEVGGTDTGPNPYELLLAGLGACTSMTLRMYADHKGWPLEGVRVALRHSRIHAADCEDCESKEGKISRIEAELELAGDLDAEQRQRLGEIAARCPVHKTLAGEIDLPIRLRE
jgi:uncharacterized OsmC-like protein/esterase/lipase